MTSTVEPPVRLPTSALAQDCPGEAKFEDDVATFNIAEIAQPHLERVEHRRPAAGRLCQDTDARDFRLRLLADRRFGRGKQCKSPADENATPSHSMTPSARARIEGGTVRPSASGAGGAAFRSRDL